MAELTAAPHVRNVKTSLTLRNAKDAAMVPMELMKRLLLKRGLNPSVNFHDMRWGEEVYFETPLKAPGKSPGPLGPACVRGYNHCIVVNNMISKIFKNN